MLRSKTNQSTNHRLSRISFNHSTVQQTFCFFLIFFSVFLFLQNAHGASVTLAWDPNSPAENIAGYRLYYGTESRNYTFMIDITDQTLKKISNLEKGQNYYFAVTAFNEAGQESEFSEELMVNTCTYRLLRKRTIFNATGGIKKIKVRTQPTCEWTVQSGESWLTILEGEDFSTGNGFITYSVEPNPDPEKRTSFLSLGGRRIKITQRGSTLP